MLRPNRSFPAALLALLLLVGCSSGRQTYQPQPAPVSSRASLVLANNSSQAIFYFYASPCSSNSWGEDQLNDAEVVMPGARKSFTMTPGCWDLKAVFRDGTDVVRRNAQISVSDWTWTVG